MNRWWFVRTPVVHDEIHNRRVKRNETEQLRKVRKSLKFSIDAWEVPNIRHASMRIHSRYFLEKGGFSLKVKPFMKQCTGI